MVKLEDTDRLIISLGAYFLGAVYLGGLILVGVAWQAPHVALLALASAGVGYVCQCLGVLPVSPLAILGTWAVSLALGSAAGVSALMAGL